MATSDTESSQSRLVRVLRTFYSVRDDVTRLHARADGYVKSIQRACGATDTYCFSDMDRRNVSKLATSAPRIIIAGEMNCGKTSLVNELLETSALPTSQKTNTARRVIIKHADTRYYRVTDESGHVLAQDTFKKKVPESLVALEQESREDRDQVLATVEIGLDKPVLRGGLEILDMPGLGETDVMNELVTRCLEENLQIIVYVINAKDRIKLTEKAYLAELVAKQVEVLFVCNKIDYDQKADDSDAFSDEDEDVTEQRHQKAIDIERENAETTLNRLKKNRLLNPSHTGQQYHALSCTKIRKARVKGRTDKYTQSFNAFVQAISEQIEQCIGSELCSIIDRVENVHHFIKNFIRDEKNEQMEGRIRDTVRQVLDPERKSVIERLVREAVEPIRRIDKDELLADLPEMDFGRTCTNNTVGERETCKSLVRFKVVNSLLNTINKLLADGVESLTTNHHDVTPNTFTDDDVTIKLEMTSLAFGDGRKWYSFDPTWHTQTHNQVANYLMSCTETPEFRSFSGPVFDHWYQELAGLLFRSVDVPSIGASIESELLAGLTKTQKWYEMMLEMLMDRVKMQTAKVREVQDEIGEKLREDTKVLDRLRLMTNEFS